MCKEINIYERYPYYCDLKKEKDAFDRELSEFSYNAISEYKKAIDKMEELPDLLDFVLKNCFFPSDEFKKQLNEITELKHLLQWIISADELIQQIENLKKQNGIVIPYENALFFAICNHIQNKILFYIQLYLNVGEKTKENDLKNFAKNYARRIKSHETLFINLHKDKADSSDDINVGIRIEKSDLSPILNQVFDRNYKEHKDRIILHLFNNFFIAHYIDTQDLNSTLKKLTKFYKGDTNALLKELPIYYNSAITLNQFCILLFPFFKLLCPDKDMLNENQYLNKHKNHDTINGNDYKRYMVKMVKNNIKTIKVL